MSRFYYSILVAGVLLKIVAIPDASYGAELAPVQQSIHQQERQRALEERLAPPTPDVRLSAPSAFFSRIIFPLETPCFVINRIKISGAEPLPRWLPLQRIADQAQGQCLGAKGINLLMSQMQNRLVDHGYVTTRVLAPQQDLNSGTLALNVVPGKIRGVELTPDSNRYVTLFSAFPARAGTLLDLRDIEQGLENLQRVPTVQANMVLIPGSAPGETDIILNWQQRKMWRLAASLDDSGTRSTGRYQGGATLFLDNPLSLSDLFYVSAGGALQRRGDKGTNNLTGHYSLPFGYWTAGMTASRYDYYQAVAGLNGDINYRGESENVAFQLSRLLHRNASQKTTFTYDVLTRSSKKLYQRYRSGSTAPPHLGLADRATTPPLYLAGDFGCRYQLSAWHPLVWCHTRAGRVFRRSHRPEQNSAIECATGYSFCGYGAKPPLQPAISAPKYQHATDAAGSVLHWWPLVGAWF